ncbi:MAG: ParB/RepB/Spo0J family partition protein [Rhodospirillaceae bacterium]|jgi:ParB family transcriptional regulator, chromosome partitioning protein|nr:ParB/RepB/Spo0J family partition protein [Rhodospirillaceae bacterium]MBT3926077.1 ParB/RepB/Spo0J family partition protein [Rhodospirillaceae bacterium]MBT4426311.1 ParB/RepB/Spo0J family partition protein [Rhodospirillaceae bacterium]MBT5038286.1 ParB/RepB/Spo0J family partition protein [Rhodospirillaceae bacterium]MBT5677024.1 ParB/RepB/Spo0J family partition protein [Rhodospirillaceae bacterium]
MSSDSSGQTPQRMRGLGSGLAALLGEGGADGVNTETTPAAARVLPIGSLRAGRLQPRTTFDRAEIESLAQSISAQGIIQPILARPAKDSDGDYEIIAGERRWRAAQVAGLHEVPVVIHFIGDQDALEIALIENLQRQDLNIFEEAEAYQHLISDYGNSQEEVAGAVGRSRSHVANTVRLLALPAEIKDLTVAGKLSPGHARVLLGAENAVEIAHKIVNENLNVRQTEKLMQDTNEGASQPVKAKKEKNADLRDLEETLTVRLGLKVTISEKKRGGSVSVQYKTLEQLDELLKKLR